MNIKPIGRYTFRNNHYYFYNGGSGFSFKMNGKSVALDLEFLPKEGYFYIIIDRDYNNKIKVLFSKGIYTYNFDRGGVHYIDVVKANESNDNTFLLKGLEVEGELLDYDHQYNGRVKVYGDSTVAGFGILSHDGEASIHNSDSVRDFCFHALYELNMDMNIFSASGFGLVFSIYTNPNDIGIINFIDKVGVFKDEEWKDEDKYDFLIISLGTNDNSYIQKDGYVDQKRVDEFKEKYKLLIDSEINKNKDIKILMVYGTLKEEQVYYLYKETYEYLAPLYKNLFIHKFNGDSSAISNHAYVDSHDEMSKELIELINNLI